MPGLTLTQADTQLAEWLAASSAVATGQAYSVNGQSLTRADARTIRENIEYWDRKIQQLAAASGASAPARAVAAFVEAE